MPYEPKQPEKEFYWLTFPYPARPPYVKENTTGTVHVVDTNDHGSSLCGMDLLSMHMRKEGTMAVGTAWALPAEQKAPLCKKCNAKLADYDQWKKRQRANETWHDRYKAYLNSEDWRRLRDRVLTRDGHLCQSCLSAPATQVHHMTYRYYNAGHDSALFLRSVCRPCHDVISEVEKHGQHNGRKS